MLAAAKSATVLVGGPPCQAFSQMRNHTRLIEDSRNALYREFVHVLGETKPLAFVMENVTGIDQMGVRDQIATDLALDDEYEVRPQVVDAANFGVPQTRKRLLFDGVRRGTGMSPPVLQGTDATFAVALVRSVRSDQSGYQVVVQDGLFSRRIAETIANPNDLAVVTVADALSDLAALPVGNRDDVIQYTQIAPPRSAYQREIRAGAGPFLTNVQVPRCNADTKLRLEGIPMGGNHRDLSHELLDRYLTGQRWGQDNGSGRLSRRHFYAYRHLHPALWAWTLNTKGDSVYHYEHPAPCRSASSRAFSRFRTASRSRPIRGRA